MDFLHPRQASPRRRRAGLEISDDAVRVADVSGGYASGLSAVATIPLPEGAVRDGEVVEPAVVSACIRDAWRAEGLKARSVVVGLGVQMTAARIVELPALRPRDLRSALAFELADVIPFPAEESVIEPLELERLTDDAGRETVRHLCIAVHRPPLVELVRMVQDARLRLLAVDVPGLGALRFARRANPSPGTGAVVSVGHGTLSVVVHRDGRPLFVRGITVSTVSAGVSGELAQELSVIDGLRGGGGTGGLPGVERDQLTNAVMATFEYHQSVDPDERIERVDVLGRADRAPRVAAELAADTGVPVSLLSAVGNPHADAVVSGVIPGEGRGGDHATAFGLAIASRNEEEGTPWPSVKVGTAADTRRGRVRVAAWSAAAGAAVVAFGVLLSDPGPAVVEAAAAEEQLAQVRTELDGLAADADAAAETNRLERLVTRSESTAIPWSALSDAIQESAPAGSTLLAVDGAAPLSGEAGSVTITAETSDVAEIEQWLSLLGEIDSLQDPWLVEVGSSGAPDTGAIFTVQASVVDPGSGSQGDSTG